MKKFEKGRVYAFVGKKYFQDMKKIYKKSLKKGEITQEQYKNRLEFMKAYRKKINGKVFVADENCAFFIDVDEHTAYTEWCKCIG